MPEYGFVKHEEPRPDQRLLDLIVQCKAFPNEEYRVATFEKKDSAEKAASRNRGYLKESEPNIKISSRRLLDVDGWGVIVEYIPPEAIRPDLDV
ncbi:MAG: hypothetical protein ACTSP0_09270 [Alphaproteobacteria bacterium]